MSVVIDPNDPDFGETRWITSEDINVEHLLDVFTTIKVNSDTVWAACANFMRHLFWHKGRLTVLEAKVEELSDDHHSKPECLFELSRLFYSVGNHAECKQHLSHALTFEGERGDAGRVARTLKALHDLNRYLGLPREGTQQAKEALEIYERLDDHDGASAMFVHSYFAITRRQAARHATEGATPRMYRPYPGERRSISPLPIPPSPWRNISIQGRDKEGHSASQSGSRTRLFFQPARPAVLGPLFPDAAVYSRRQARRRKHSPRT